MKRLFALLMVLAVLPVLGDEEHPLLPADTSSPRATLDSFMENCSLAYSLLKTGGRSHDNKQTAREARRVIRQILRCMDLSEIAEFRRYNAAKEAAVALKETLDRIELPSERNIPDREDMTKEDDSLLEKWTIPNTEITFRLVKEGPRAGTYQFSPDTVKRANEFYERVRQLPYKNRETEGFAIIYLTSPGSSWLAGLIARLPDYMRERTNGQARWQWVGLVLALLFMAALMALVYYLGRRVSCRGAEGGLLRYVLGLVFPIIAVAVPVHAQEFITNELVISGPLLYVLKFNLSLIALFAGMIVVLGIGRRVGEVIASAPQIPAQSIDAQLVRMMCRMIGFAAAMVLLLQGGKHLGIPLSSLLAGAGVIGMALALSAQDLLKNVFGSIMLIMDKPFTVGERIKVKHYDGVVEEIGLRSTKIRLLNGHQASIPNEDMAKTDIENVGRRPFIRRVSKIPLSIDIESAKAQKAVSILKEILKDHEGLDPDFPPRVWLDEFARDHLELKLIYWYHPPDYWDYTAHADQVNRRILDAFEEEGIAMALPAFITKVEDQTGLPVVPPQS
jgi:MscS family membrane protein